MRLLLAAVVALAVNAAPAKPEVAKGFTRAEACKRRFVALCRVLHRCASWAGDMGGEGCEAIDPGCEKLAGAAPYDEQAVARCTAELDALKCPASAGDPNDPAAMDFEAKAAACKPLVAADAKLAKAEAADPKDAKAKPEKR